MIGAKLALTLAESDMAEIQEYVEAHYHDDYCLASRGEAGCGCGLEQTELAISRVRTTLQRLIDELPPEAA